MTAVESSTEPDWLSSGQAAVALSWIDTDLAEWRKKVALCVAVWREGEPRRVSTWQLAGETGINHQVVSRLVKELAKSRVLLQLEVRRGRVATLWAINPNIAAWGSTGKEHRVPWRRGVTVAHVIGIVHNPEKATSPRLRDTTALGQRATEDCARPVASRRAQERRARGGRPYAARKRTGSARRAATRSAQTGLDALVVVPPPSGGVDNLSTAPGVEQERGEAAHRQAVGVAKAAICAAAAPGRGGRAPFINPKSDEFERVAELVRSVGTPKLLEWLPSAPMGLQVPGLLGWLDDQAHLPTAELLDPEFLAKLAARASAPDPADAPLEPRAEEPDAGQTGPNYQPYGGWQDKDTDVELPAEVAELDAQAARRAARQRLGRPPSDPDGTMDEATGGA